MRRSILFLFALAACSMLLPAVASAETGAELYKTYCSTCHGESGKGDGAAAAALDPKPADFSTAKFWEGKDDAHMTKVIKEGGAAVGKSPLMAPWGSVLKDDQVKAVVDHIKSLKAK